MQRRITLQSNKCTAAETIRQSRNGGEMKWWSIKKEGQWGKDTSWKGEGKIQRRGNAEDKGTKTKNELKCMCTNMRSLMNENKGRNWKWK